MILLSSYYAPMAETIGNVHNNFNLCMRDINQNIKFKKKRPEFHDDLFFYSVAAGAFCSSFLMSLTYFVSFFP
jgi:hypothetical protein